MAKLKSHFRVVYEGTRWKIIFGSYKDNIEKFAVNEIQRMAQSLFPYVMETVFARDLFLKKHNEHLIIIGTPVSNIFIRELEKKKKIQIPRKAEAYGISILESPWNPERRIIAIGGYDAKGLLNGIEDFNARVLELENPGTKLEEIADLSFSDYPRMQHRGIWTWGYVIYDYRRFLDNMARLRMNMITIWNDQVPVNIDDIIDYAHSRGIKVVLGFHWGWGHTEVDLSKKEDVKILKKEIIENYTKNYSHIKHDGIYFQTLTEHHNTEIGGKSLAEIVCSMVNEIGGALLKKYPGLHIQFGLHATSIVDDYKHLEKLDKRINIVWEDGGTIPYLYTPELNKSRVKGLESIDATIEYSKKLASMRGCLEFSSVPKGFCALRWGAEFENHGSFILGERSNAFMEKRLEQRTKHWQKINGLWMANYRNAVKFYREVLKVKPETTIVTALVEDGNFENCIQSSVALFSAILWNPDTDEDILPRIAHSSYFKEIE